MKDFAIRIAPLTKSARPAAGNIPTNHKFTTEEELCPLQEDLTDLLSL
jgi:hypothetical protein